MTSQISRHGPQNSIDELDDVLDDLLLRHRNLHANVRGPSGSDIFVDGIYAMLRCGASTHAILDNERAEWQQSALQSQEEFRAYFGQTQVAVQPQRETAPVQIIPDGRLTYDPDTNWAVNTSGSLIDTPDAQLAKYRRTMGADREKVATEDWRNVAAADNVLMGSAAASPTSPGWEMPAATPAERRNIQRVIVSNLLYYLVLVGLMFGIFLVTGKDDKPRNILGYSYFTVLTPSMQSVIPKGSIVVTKKTPSADIKVGDDITFFKDEKTTVTHRVYEIYEDYQGSGLRGFITKGVDNSGPDRDVVIYKNVIGVVQFSIPKVGAVLSAIKDNVLLMAVTFGLIIIFSVCLRVILHR